MLEDNEVSIGTLWSLVSEKVYEQGAARATVVGTKIEASRDVLDFGRL